MSTSKLERVVFHSKEDMSAGYNLKKAEALLNNLAPTDEMDINDLLELYNIKQYFDNNIFLTSWDESTKKNYQQKILQAEKKLKDHFRTLDNENIIQTVHRLEFSYRNAFWYLFNYYQIYKQIKKEIFSELLEGKTGQIRYILSHRNTVAYFEAELRGFLLGFEETAELLLAKFEQGDSSREVHYIFPKSLSLADKEDILLRYLNQEVPNLNYIRLIERSKDSNDLKLSIKTRLLAKKRSEELNNKIFETGVSWLVGVEILLEKDQDEPVIISQVGHRRSYSYSLNYLDKVKDDVDLFMLYRNLFHMIDHTGLITLYNRESEMDVMERLLMKSKNEYPQGTKFMIKNKAAFLQVITFGQYLKQLGRTSEELIQSFIQSGLNKDLGLTGLQIRFPTKNSTYLEKIRLLAPELEFLLRQYQVYSTEGKIDFELIEIDSSPLKLGDIKSLVEKKYVYPKGEKIEGISSIQIKAV